MDTRVNKTITHFGARSDSRVRFIASVFALGGSAFVVFFGPESIWGLWIPFCFITIPPIHMLCRAFVRMQERIDDLERRLAASSPGENTN